MSCGTINTGSQPDCNDLPDAGTRARLVLMNYSEVANIITSDDGVVLSIEMEAGKQGYEFLGFRNDVKKSDDVVKGKLKSKFRHNLSFVIYEVDQLQKNNIKKITRGRFIAIIENKGKGPDSIELLGKNVGLQIVGGLIRDAHQNGGLFVINLSTPQNDAEFEKKLPQSVGTTYENGLAIIESVLAGSDLLTVDNSTITVDSILYTVDQTIL
jgi:hypothetical protein